MHRLRLRISAQHRKEVLRGLRHVGNLLLGFLTLVLVGGGLIGFSDSPGRFGRIGDCTALLPGASILVASANRWKTWIAGFFGSAGIINGIGMMLSGLMLAWPYKSVPRDEVILVVIFAVLLAVLTFPSKDFCRPPDRIGRVLLAAAVIAFFLAAGSEKTNYVWLGCCLGLFAAEKIRLRMGARRAGSIRQTT